MTNKKILFTWCCHDEG